jgi:hypothetical protein
MGEMERRGYVRMSDPTAAYAFYVHPLGYSLLNLHWLIEIVEQYEATARKLGDIPTEQDRLELMRLIAMHVDDDRLAWFMRHTDHGNDQESLGQ